MKDLTLVGGPAAQLSVVRSGQITWYRRDAGELWSLTPKPSPLAKQWSAAVRAAAVGGWLTSAADGAPIVIAASPDDGEVTALLVHPRAPIRFVGSAGSLLVDGPHGVQKRHDVSVSAMVMSSDLRRLYVVSRRAELWVVPIAADPELPEPELILEDLFDRFGAISDLAMSPAGLVMVAQHALLGVNVRHRTVTTILGAIGSAPAHRLLPELARPAVAVDHQQTIYLADRDSVICCRGDGTDLRRCS